MDNLSASDGIYRRVLRLTSTRVFIARRHATRSKLVSSVSLVSFNRFHSINIICVPSLS